MHKEAHVDSELVAKRLRMARAGAKLSLSEMAHEMSKRMKRPISRETVRRIENDARDIELAALVAAAEITGEPLEWLMGRDAVAAVTSSNVDGATGRYLKQGRSLRTARFRLTPVPA